jgi:hypothetical protein
MLDLQSSSLRRSILAGCLIAAAGCSDESPTELEVTFGETTFVILANPVINDDTEAAVPAPGSEQSSVLVAVADGPSGTTNANGVVVLTDIVPGTKTLSVGGNEVLLSIADRDLREVAVASDGSAASVMAEVPYAFGGQVIEITSSMSLAEVNDALGQSNTIVFFRAGTYTGDLSFSGSNVTLFGEGPTGGSVTLDGNVIVDGSSNRLRGADITGTLSIPGSDVGVSFSRVAGDVQIDGSDTVLLANAFCGTVTISGSGLTALGNAGMAPIPAPTTGC